MREKMSEAKLISDSLLLRYLGQYITAHEESIAQWIAENGTEPETMSEMFNSPFSPSDRMLAGKAAIEMFQELLSDRALKILSMAGRN